MRETLLFLDLLGFAIFGSIPGQRPNAPRDCRPGGGPTASPPSGPILDRARDLILPWG
jgi:hypothetical protein